VISTGRVHVAPTEQPATANLMSTPDVALNMAEAEPPPIPPSLPIPAPVHTEPPRALPNFEPPKKRRKSSAAGIALWALGGLIGVILIGGVVYAVIGGYPSKTHGAPTARATPRSSATAVPTTSVASRSLPSASAAAAPQPSASVASAPEPTSNEVLNALAKAPSCDALLGSTPRAAGVYPGAAWEQIRAARKHLVRGDLDAAEGAYCMAMGYDPKNAEAVGGLARVLIIRRDAEASIHWAREAVKFDPDDRARQILLGDALALSGDMGKAIEPFLLGFGIGPSDASARRTMVSAQLKLGDDSAKRQDQAAAERAYRRAIVLDDKNAWAAAGIARSLLDQGHAQAALHWAKRAASLDPKSALAEIVMGDAMQKLGDASSASAAWKKAAELDPNDPSARARALTAE
jgi:tetratricopeptide (TPR) repeat protein